MDRVILNNRLLLWEFTNRKDTFFINCDCNYFGISCPNCNCRLKEKDDIKKRIPLGILFLSSQSDAFQQVFEHLQLPLKELLDYHYYLKRR